MKRYSKNSFRTNDRLLKFETSRAKAQRPSTTNTLTLKVEDSEKKHDAIVKAVLNIVDKKSLFKLVRTGLERIVVKDLATGETIGCLIVKNGIITVTPTHGYMWWLAADKVEKKTYDVSLADPDFITKVKRVLNSYYD